MKFIGIIPARYASTRFPGKPLAMLDGKPVIQHVYEKVASCLEAAYVATDDERIFNAVEAFGGKAVMTRKDHKSGTDRIEEAIEKIGGDWDVIVNVQGDEPFVDKSQLETICQCFDDPTTQIATLGKAFTSMEAVKNPNSPKIVVDNQGFAMYFSRSIIPYVRGKEEEEWLKFSLSETFGHLCLPQRSFKRGNQTATKLTRNSREPGTTSMAAEWLQDKSWYYRCRNCRHRHARRFAAGRRLFEKQKVIRNIIYF